MGSVRWGAAALAAVALVSAPGCASRSPLLVGDPATMDIAGLVDSEPAQRLLADILHGRPADTRLARRVPSPLSTDIGAAPGVPPHASLSRLARDVSADFAALTFARAASAEADSRRVQAAFARYLRDREAVAERALRRRAGVYTVLFAPSWMYRSHPETGADFGPQRRLLDRLGIANRLIQTGESASVEDNAAVIAAEVRAAPRHGRALILVSASKSGAEVALALSRLLEPGETAGVAAWLNIVGALGGSPLADAALRPPVSWIARGVFWLRGWDWAGLASMATEPSRRRLDGAAIPDGIAVVNVVAVPVSGTVGPEVWLGYRMLREHGPNDGVVLLTDAVWPGGVTLPVLGPDHLYEPRRDEAHGVALLRAVDLAIRLRADRGGR